MKFRPQFTLRRCLVGVGLLALLLGLLEVFVLGPARHQRSVVEAVHALGGRGDYEFEVPADETAGDWRRTAAKVVGKDYLGDVSNVSLMYVEDADQLTAVLERVAGLGTVKDLSLAGAAVNQQGIAAISQMTELEELSLGGNDPLDLAPLSKLQKLNLLLLNSRTGITPKQMAAVAAFPALEELDLSFSDADDQAIEPLLRSRSLKQLWIPLSEVTSDGVRKLLKSATLRTLVLDSEQAEGVDFSTTPAIDVVIW